MDSDLSPVYTMPAFDRVRENFLKKVEDELLSKASALTYPTGKNVLVRAISSLGHPKAFTETTLRNFCVANTSSLDGKESTVEFMLHLFTKFTETPVEMEHDVQYYSNEKSEQPFQWPLVDMAEYEFGREVSPSDMNNREVSSKGYAFIEMERVSEAWHAYEALDGFAWPCQSGPVQEVIFGSCSLQADGRAFTPWRVQMFKNYNRRKDSSSGSLPLVSTVAMTGTQERRADGLSRDVVGASFSGFGGHPLQGDWHGYANASPSNKQETKRRNVPRTVGSTITAAGAGTDGDVMSGMTNDVSSISPEEAARMRMSTGSSILAHISRQLAVTEGGVECSSPLQFSSRNQLENDDSVVIGREYALPMLSSEGILRGNLRPSEVLAISSLGKKDGRVLSSVRGCVGGDGGKRESDDVLLGSSSEDYDESEENEEGGGGDEDGGEEGWSTDGDAETGQCVASRGAIERLVVFMQRLKSSMSHAVLSDDLSASSLDDMWEEANEMLERALRRGGMGDLLRAEHRYTLALKRCIPSYESDALSSDSQEALSPLLHRSRHAHSPSPDGIFTTDSEQTHTSLGTIVSLLQASVDNISESPQEDRGRPGGDDANSVAGIHVMLSTLRDLALAAWVCRSEQRVVGLKRLYHQKAASAAECEEHLEEMLGRSRQYTSQIQSLQRRVGELQESLSYHRVAADRTRSLEAILAEAESDRDEAVEAQRSLERKLKRCQSLLQQQQQQLQQQQQQQQQQQYQQQLLDRERETCGRGSGRGGRGSASMLASRDETELMRRSDDFDVTRAPRIVRELSSISTDDWSTLPIEQLSKIESYMTSLASTVHDARDIAIQRQAKKQDSQRKDDAENALCCVCRDNNKTVLLLPCKHLCLCEGCSEHIGTRRMTACPVCRQAVSDVLRVYI